MREILLANLFKKMEFLTRGGYQDEKLAISPKTGKVVVCDVETHGDGDVCSATIIKEVLKPERSEWGIVVDIGAYVGWITLLSALLGYKVHSFEPNPDTFQILDRNVKRNGLADKVVLDNRAISREKLQVPYYGSKGEGTIRKMNEQPTYVVQTDRLDNVIDEDIVLLKIDAEGNEFNVVESAKKIFQTKKIYYMIVEFTTWWFDFDGAVLDWQKDKVSDKCEKMLQLFTDYGFEIYCMSRSGNPFICGPIQKEDFEAFINDHHQRHLQTDLFLRNKHLVADELSIKIHKWERGKYYA